MRLKLFVYIFILLCPLSALAQPTQTQGMQRVVILNADTIRNIFIDDVQIERLIGNVEIGHNNIIMTCDSAYMFPNQRFEAYGNVILVNKSTTVSGDHMIYDGNKNLAQIRGEIVYLTDGTSTLRTSAIDYDSKEEVGYFQYEGTIRDPQSLLESKHGYYYSKLKDFVFIGNVESQTENYTLSSDSMTYNTDTKIFYFYSHTHIWSNNSYLYCDNGWYDSMNEIMFFKKNSFILSEKQEIWADSIYYESHTKQGKLYSNIQFLDTAQKSIAFGDLADFNIQTENFKITTDPSILFYSPQEDTIYVRADTLKSIISQTPIEQIKIIDTISNKTTDSTYREVLGIKNVRIFRNDFQAACDSLYFGTLDSIWKMYYTPIIWNEGKMQLTSDTIKFFIVDGKMHRAEFQNNSMIIMPESDSSQYYNQIKGKNMTGYFENNELQQLNIFGNIQSAFFSSEEQAISQHEAGSMTIRFKNKKVRQVVYYSKPTAKAVPLFMVEEDALHLKGFAWHEDTRPKSKDDILKRTVRLSQRAKVNAIPKPEFPITKWIDELEQEIIEEGNELNYPIPAVPVPTVSSPQHKALVVGP